MSTTIQRPFGGQQRAFRLTMPHLADIERHSGCGPQELARRLVHGEWRVGDVRHVLRLGLAGAGMDPAAADKLVDQHLADTPLRPAADTAAAVVWGLLIGADAVDQLDRPDEEGEGDGSTT